MKFNKKRSNKLFVFLILNLIIISIIIAIITRKSIKEINFSDIQNNIDTFFYTSENKLEVFNNIFLDYKNNNNNLDFVISNSQCIAKVIPTNDVEIANKAIIRKVKIEKIFKGNIDSSYIYIYEPVTIITGNTIEGGDFRAALGYNFMNADNEYIVFLNKFNAPEKYNKTFKEENAYLYVNPEVSKIPVKENSNSYYLQDMDNYSIDYSKIKYCDQIFYSKEDLEQFKNIRKEILYRYENIK